MKLRMRLWIFNLRVVESCSSGRDIELSKVDCELSLAMLQRAAYVSQSRRRIS